MKIGTLPDGSKGFDVNATITPQAANLFVQRGYTFAIRYVRRAARHDYDVTAGELATLLEAGLGVMLVQHVAAEGWTANAGLGAAYGTIAASEASNVGYPRGATLWCDLEGLAYDARASDVIEFCNNWHAAVASSGYHPGLYVGDSCGLTAQQLYADLRFDCYWKSYNLNADQIPAVRGVCMSQQVARLSDLVLGYTTQSMDVDFIKSDAKGGTPTLVLP